MVLDFKFHQNDEKQTKIKKLKIIRKFSNLPKQKMGKKKEAIENASVSKPFFKNTSICWSGVWSKYDQM